MLLDVPPFRPQVISILSDIGPVAVPMLQEALKHKNRLIRAGAAEALGEIGPTAKDAVPALEGALEDKDEYVRWAAARALAKLGLPGKALPVLIATLDDEWSFHRRDTAWILGEVGPPAKAAIPALTKALKDEDGGVRQTAARALGNIGPAAKEAVPALEEALQDKDKWVRHAAAEALKKIQQKHPATAPTQPAKGS